MSASLFKIYDLWGTKQSFFFEESTSYEVNPLKELLKYNLLEYLIIPTSKFTNSKPYLIGYDKVIIDDYLKYKITNDIETNVFHIIDEIKKVSDRLNTTSELNISNWFSAHNGYDHNLLNNRKIASDNLSLVIPVPDFMSIGVQDIILDESKKYCNTSLLWRSVAAVLGAEEEIKKYNIKKDDVILVEDRTEKYVLVSKIKYDYSPDKKRLIPCHSIFISEELNSKKRNYWLSDKTTTGTEKLNLIDEKNGFIKPIKWTRRLNRSLLDVDYSDAKLVITIGDSQQYNNYTGIPIIHDTDNIFIARGAARYAVRSKYKIVSFYDQCKNLSLVITNKNEEIKFENLIEKNDRLPGGIKKEYDPVYGISLQVAKGAVDFYLNLGENRKDKRLKILHQKFDLSKYVNKSIQIPLVLYPSITAGQGNAQVHIMVSDSECYKNINVNELDVFLDWKNMKDASDDNNNPITLSYLEETMERSFPPVIPPVKYDRNSFIKLSYYVEPLINNKIGIFDIDSYNNSKKLYPTAKDLSRFEVCNCFGSDIKGHDSGLPSSYYHKELAKKYFDKLDYSYKNAPSEDYKKCCIKLISWTFQSTRFNNVIEDCLELVRERAFNYSGLSIEYFVLCGNMIRKAEHIEAYLNCFFYRLKKHNGLNNWIYGAIKIMMFNSEYFDDSKIDIDSYYEAINNLLEIDGLEDSKNLMKNVIDCILFMLKIRRKYSNFCKIESNDIRDIQTREKIFDTIQKSIAFNLYELIQKEADLLFKYLNGKGNLNLPTVDD